MSAQLFHNRHREAARCYLELCRRVQAALAEGRRVRINGADPPEGYDREGWRRVFLESLDRRINLKAGPLPRWRKLDPQYQQSLWRHQQRPYCDLPVTLEELAEAFQELQAVNRLYDQARWARYMAHRYPERAWQTEQSIASATLEYAAKEREFQERAQHLDTARHRMALLLEQAPLNVVSGFISGIKEGNRGTHAGTSHH